MLVLLLFLFFTGVLCVVIMLVTTHTTAKYRKVSGEEHREWYQKLWNKDKP